MLRTDIHHPRRRIDLVSRARRSAVAARQIRRGATPEVAMAAGGYCPNLRLSVLICEVRHSLPNGSQSAQLDKLFNQFFVCGCNVQRGLPGQIFGHARRNDTQLRRPLTVHRNHFVLNVHATVPR